jgi:hypothetical protein
MMNNQIEQVEIVLNEGCNMGLLTPEDIQQ